MQKSTKYLFTDLCSVQKSFYRTFLDFYKYIKVQTRAIKSMKYEKIQKFLLWTAPFSWSDLNAQLTIESL